jgi:non-heme chloroperoxidase
MLSNSKINYASIGGGISLPYTEQGDPNGSPVIFLHGVTDSHRSFDLVMPYLPADIRAIAITQRGHGDAPRLEGGYGPADLAGDLRAFIDALDIDKAIIVGHSMGSFAAQRFAIENPDRVSGLVLIGSFVTCGDNPGVIEFVRTAISGLTDPISPEFARDFQASTTALDVNEEFFEMAVAESLKVPARIWKEACESMIVNDHSSELGRISAQTRLIWGSSDAYFDRAVQERLLSLIPDSELVVYEGAGHAPHWELPESLAADVAAFVHSVENADRILERAAA